MLRVPVLAHVVVCLLALAVPASASAFGVVRPIAGDGLRCVVNGVPVCDTAGSCAGIGTGCVGAPMGICVSRHEVLCLTGSETECPTGTVLRVLEPAADLVVCVPRAYMDCSGLLSCFRNGTGPELVRPRDGDCDNDGVRNRYEVDGQACSEAPELGVVVDGECEPARLCSPDRECEDDELCGEIPGSGHRYCQATEGPTVLCCNIGLPCVDTAEACETLDEDDDAVCGLPYCPNRSFAFRLQCFQFDGFPVADVDDGDCDLDGLKNGDEAFEDPGSECVPVNVVPADGGLPDGGLPDGGPRDAGRGDAGVLDAGARPSRDIRFGGGGGCACRAAPGTRSGGGLVAPLFGLVWLRRRWSSR
ncbi:MAG: hypothetical protein AB8I08_14520 [Sandaracinaceae bacterium]